jgi:hypothetical protein
VSTVFSAQWFLQILWRLMVNLPVLRRIILCNFAAIN